jgi:arsenate reductase
MVQRKLTVYYYPPCGTCRAAIKWLKARGHDLDLRNLWEEAPDEKQLEAWIPASGLPIQRWFNVSGDVYRQMGLKNVLPTLSDEEKIKLLASNGRLVKRPIVTDGERITVGFSEEMFESVWS